MKKRHRDEECMYKRTKGLGVKKGQQTLYNFVINKSPHETIIEKDETLRKQI